MQAWIKDRDEKIQISIKVQPGASRDAVAGIREDSLLIRLCSPPVDGRANDSLIRFIADKLGVSKSSVSLIKGMKNRKKVIEVAGVSIADAENALSPQP